MYYQQLRDALDRCEHKRLKERIGRLAAVLRQFPKDLEIHQRINAFYYMQKVEEMGLLEASLHENVDRILSLLRIMDVTFVDVAAQWKEDAVWLNRHLVVRGLAGGLLK